MAVGAPGVATQEAAQGQPTAAQRTMHAQGFEGIMRAGGVMAAGAVAAIHNPQKGGDAELIATHEAYEQVFHPAR